MLIKDAAADLLALDEKEQNEITAILKSTDATLLVAMTDHIVATDTENSETKKTIEKLTDGLAALRRSDYMNSLEKSLDNTVDKLQARQMQLVRVFLDGNYYHFLQYDILWVARRDFPQVTQKVEAAKQRQQELMTLDATTLLMIDSDDSDVAGNYLDGDSDYEEEDDDENEEARIQRRKARRKRERELGNPTFISVLISNHDGFIYRFLLLLVFCFQRD
jgi:hypothetical protein